MESKIWHRIYWQISGGTRSSVTITRDLLYMLSGIGKLVCMNTKDGLLFCLSGYGMEAIMLSLSPDGTSVTKKWFSESFDNHMGAAVLLNGYLYGSGYEDPSWQCYNWVTGEKMYSSRDLFMGAVISADGMLYCCSEKGKIALVKPEPSGFNIISRMIIQKGSGTHWVHPVIHEGVLYVPRGEALIAYKIM